jgi:hypothetical protein
MNLFFPDIKPDFWSRDVDIFWGGQEEFLDRLSIKSRLPVTILVDMSLQSYKGLLAEKIYCNTRNKLILPLVNRGRSNTKSGLRYCPRCLKKDSKPYFRKHWRLSFVTTCVEHLCFLQNCCPNCHSPITLYKMHDSHDFYRCHKCGASLLDAEVKMIPKESYGIRAQQNLLNILNSGVFTFEKNEYISLAYFPVFKQIAKLIYNSSFRKGILEYECLSKIVHLPKFNKKPSVYTEDISIEEQYVLYSLVEYVLQTAERINMFCESNKIGRSELTHSMEFVPFWYESIVRDNDYSDYGPSIEEIKSATFYLESRGIDVSLNALSKLMGVCLDQRKRNDIKNVAQLSHIKPSSF